MDMAQNVAQAYYINYELTDSLFHHFKQTDVQEANRLFQNRFESALNRQRVHLDNGLNTARSMRAVYLGMFLTMTSDIWLNNGILNAHVFVGRDKMVLFTELERTPRAYSGEPDLAFQTVTVRRLFTKLEGLCSIPSDVKFLTRLKTALGLLLKADRCVKLFAFSIDAGKMSTSFPKQMVKEWEGLLARRGLGQEHLDEALNSVHCVSWSKPEYGSEYEAYDQHGRLQRYVSSEQSPLMVKSRFGTHLRILVEELLADSKRWLVNYFESRTVYLRELYPIGRKLIRIDNMSTYRFLMAGALNFEVRTGVQIVPRFTLTSIEDITIMVKNLPGTFMRSNTPFVFKLYEQASDINPWLQRYGNFIPAEIQTETLSYHAMLMSQAYADSQRVDSHAFSGSLMKERPSWFATLYESDLSDSAHTNIFSEHLNRFLTFFDASMLEHHLFGQLTTLEGARERYVMNFGSNQLTGAKPRIFSGLTIYHTGIALMINVANPDTFGEENIGLDTILVEKKVRPLLQNENVQKLIVCNVDFSPPRKRGYIHRLRGNGWTMRSFGVPYTHESNQFKGMLFSRSMMVDSPVDWTDTLNVPQYREPYFVNEPVAFNFILNDAYTTFRQNPDEFFLRASAEASQHGLGIKTAHEALAVLDGMMSSRCFINYPETQAEQLRTNVMFLRPVNTPTYDNMWFHVFSECFPDWDLYRDQVFKLMETKSREARSYHNQ